MGIFSFNTEPGPGISPDAPRKTGLARVVEVLGRDLWSFFKAGFLAVLSLVPFLFGIAFAVVSHALLVAVLAGVIGGLIAAPQLCAMADTVLRSLRDEPGFWWQTYRRAWKRNGKASLLPGGVFGLLCAMEIFMLFHLGGADSFVTGVFLVGIVLVWGVFTYVWAQLPLLELPFGLVLKNAALLFLAYLPRSLGAAAVQVVYWGAIVLFFPYSALMLPVTNLWIPMVFSLMIVYPALEKSFQIEENARKRRDAELEESRRDGGQD